MPQAIKQTTIIEPTLAEVKHITFGGDLTNAGGTVVTVAFSVKDDAGEIVEEFGVVIEGINGLAGFLTSFQNAVLPKVVEKVEQELGITFV